MPIISKVAAKTPKGRLMHGAIFLALTIGGLTMLYPFVLMMSGSLRSELDETDLDLVPRFLFDQDMVYRKFIETKYNQDIQTHNRAHLRQDFNFRTAQLPSEVRSEQVDDFKQFIEEESPPRHWQTLGGILGVRTVPENLRKLRNRLADHFDNNLDTFNRETGAVLPSWQTIVLPPPEWQTLRYDYADNILFHTYFDLQDEAPLAERAFVSITGYFLETMIYPTYGQVGTTAFNEAHVGFDLENFRTFSIPQQVPGENQPTFRAEWIEFVREELNPSFVLLDESFAPKFHDYLEETYLTTADLNYSWGTEYAAFSEVPLPTGEWLRGGYRTDYHEFLLDLEPEDYRLTGPEFAWRDWLTETYGTIDNLNEAYDSNFASFASIHLPQDQIEMTYVTENTGTLRYQYSIRNFVNVFDALFLRGRAFINTVIFCTLSVGLSLLINPLTAYALSRFQLPGSYKILLFVMATMAFPPMVTLIPTFIILQNLNMMNTFAALVLPTVANGYLIFLLKGFFDSLPQDLYNAAMIDGASEFRIFFQITMALSKPILAVVALMAFNSAYTMFLYPLLVAPREDMWLLSVWLYQYREVASMGGVFASVLVSSIPTLTIFIFCQNIIMRGIVVPVEK